MQQISPVIIRTVKAWQLMVTPNFQKSNFSKTNQPTKRLPRTIFQWQTWPICDRTRPSSEEDMHGPLSLWSLAFKDSISSSNSFGWMTSSYPHLDFQQFAHHNKYPRQVPRVNCLIVLPRGGFSHNWYYFDKFDASRDAFPRGVRILVLSRFYPSEQALPHSSLIPWPNLLLYLNCSRKSCSVLQVISLDP